ncbi:THAP domain-containing protein 5-like [Ornithodoros turicata]|uniref:THAP domain-containing protein 5-like n=1 Tax=Ornithodoros turicata TaxID=34597 RepID=UPI0031396A77
MSYCCLPGCKSDSKNKVKGISFHEISEERLRVQWLKAISRPDWCPKTYPSVCSLHFTPSDFKESCKTRRLKRGAVPSVFEDTYCSPPAPKKKRDEDGAAQTNANIPQTFCVLQPPLTVHGVEFVQEGRVFSSPSSQGSGLNSGCADVNVFSQSVNVTPTLKDQAVQVDIKARTSASVLERRRGLRKERDLKSRIRKLQFSLDSVKTELKNLKEGRNASQYLDVVAAAETKDDRASFLLDQVKNFKRKTPSWYDLTLRHAVVLKSLSTHAYLRTS